MKKTIINSTSNVWVNAIVLPDDWTGSEDEWQLPAGQEFVDGEGGPGQVWNGTSFDPAPVIPVTEVFVSFDDFEERFTTAEWDAATDFVYEVDLTTGKPKRRALVQGLARAQARNTVDLLDAKTDAFLGLLVSGGVLTEARRAVILTP